MCLYITHGWFFRVKTVIIYPIWFHTYIYKKQKQIITLKKDWTPSTNPSCTFMDIITQDRQNFSCGCKQWYPVVTSLLLRILRDSGTSISALTLLFILRADRGCLSLSLSFGLAGWAAGGVSVLSAAATGQNQLAAILSGAEFIPIPGTSTVPAVCTGAQKPSLNAIFHIFVNISLHYSGALCYLDIHTNLKWCHCWRRWCSAHRRRKVSLDRSPLGNVPGTCEFHLLAGKPLYTHPVGMAGDAGSKN